MQAGDISTVTAFIGSISGTVDVECVSEVSYEIESITVNANPKYNIAGGTSTITAIVTDTDGQFVPDGTAVYFITSSGTLSASSANTVNGMATVNLELSASMQAGDISTVTAFIGSISGTVDVECDTEEGPTAVINSTPDPAKGIVPFELYLDAYASTSQSGIVSYEWDFGDNTTGTGEVINHTYSHIGTYTVVLTVTDSNGKKGYDNISVEVVKPPVAVINTTPPHSNGVVSGVFPFKVYFDAYESTSESGIVSYFWEFGENNEMGTGITTNHTYNEPGIYTVYLTVTDSNGFEAYDSVIVSEPQVETIVTADPETITPGGSSTISAFFKYSTGIAIPDGTNVTFSISGDTDGAIIATISGETTNGLASAILTMNNPGTVIVKAETTYSSGTVNVTCEEP
jgi:PKD repeat protein